MDEQKKQHILATALEVFFKYGYKRVSMNDIAEAAEISRAGLYLYFKSKEEVFNSVVLLHGDILIDEISKGLSSKKTAEEKIFYAFEVWAINHFDLTLDSPEMREVTDSSFAFAREALDTSFQKFEDILTPLLIEHFGSASSRKGLVPEQLAHILSCSLRGFKIVAKNSAELRKLVQDLLGMALAD